MSTKHVASVINTRSCLLGAEMQCLEVRLPKIIQLVGRYGTTTIKSHMLRTILLSADRLSFIHSLLQSGTCCSQTIMGENPIRSLDPKIALLFLQSSNQPALLEAVQCACITTCGEDGYRAEQLLLLQLLTLSGAILPLHVMVNLRDHHHDVYMWCTRYRTLPAPLSHISRIVIRKSMTNVLHGVDKLNLPSTIKYQLLFLNQC